MSTDERAPQPAGSDDPAIAEAGLAPVPDDILIEAPPEVAARSPLSLFWRRARKDRVAMVALVFIVLLLLVALFAPLIVKLAGAPPPNEIDLTALSPEGLPTGPSSEHILGVDNVGRDVFSRVIYGSRISLQVAVYCTTIILFLGVTAGLIAGYFRGWTDTILARVFDIMLALPFLMLAVGIASACTGIDSSGTQQGCFGGLIQPGLRTIIFVLAIAGWAGIARVIRGQVLSLREKEFVDASRALGASNARIIFREILPNLIAPIIVFASISIPVIILGEAALSFIGIGIQPPTASWGAMIADAVPIFDTAWWFMLFPGLALLFTVLAFNLLGDGLQDAINPRTSSQ